MALLGLLAGAPLLAQAQTSTAPDAAPRYYLGLAAYSSYYQRLGNQNFGGFQLPVQLTAGYQWRPRLAVQVGVAYSQFSNPYDYQATFVGSDGSLTPLGRRGRASSHLVSVSALGRYTLTKKPAHRVQFDLLGGLTLEHGRYRDQGTTSDGTQQLAYDNAHSTSALLLTLGPSVRCRLSRSLELCSDYTFNVNVATNAAYPPERLSTAGSLGLRYRFGAR